MTRTLGIGAPGAKEVTVIAHDAGTGPSGERKFCVLNGSWDGAIKDGVLYYDHACKSPSTAKAAILWEGNLSYSSYGDGMDKINAKLKEASA